MPALVSIIMPAYNAASTIADSIASALGQTHREVELIVIDDGSRDATPDIVSGVRDSRIVLHRNNRQGVSAARNQGLKAAQGDCIKYLDSDDMLNDTALERQLARLAEFDGLALCTSSWGRYYHSLADLRFVRSADWQDLDPMSFLELSIGGGGTMPVMTWLIPQVLARKVGDWPVGAQLCEDTEYGTRLALGAERVLFCNEAWGYYRTKPSGSLSATRDAETFRHALACVERICDLILQGESSPRVRRMLANFCRRYTIQVTGIDSGLACRADALVAKFGGSSVEPSGGRLYMGLSRVLGWRTALSLKRRLGR
jgi:glycosyltransferase involved in cell wall biosynthesis